MGLIFRSLILVSLFIGSVGTASAGSMEPVYIEAAKVFKEGDALYRKFVNKEVCPDDCAKQAIKIFSKIVYKTPNYWPAWGRLGETFNESGQVQDALTAYEHALSGMKICKKTPGACEDFNKGYHATYLWVLYQTAQLNLYLSNYRRAQELFLEALSEENFSSKITRRYIVQWLTMAEFGAEGLDAAWAGYKGRVSGISFVKSRYGAITEIKIRHMTKIPGGFLDLVYGAFTSYARRTEIKNISFAAYRHYQNLARLHYQTMGGMDKVLDMGYYTYKPPYERKLLALYGNKIVNVTKQDGGIVEVLFAQSRYGVLAMSAAEKLVDKSELEKATELYRRATITDPWWIDPYVNLLRLEFILVGTCRVYDLVDKIHNLSSFYPRAPHAAEYSKIAGQYYRDMRALEKAASDSGSKYIEGGCYGEGGIKPDYKIPG